jgi:DNA-binding response OmpR family regulator
MAKRRILLVDGDEGLLRSVKEGLEAHDASYAVDCAKDASECMRCVGEKRPDLILLGVALPGLDGFALRAKLKATDAKDVPVIYMTAEYEIGMTRRIGMLTADDLIRKPISIPELILRMQKILMMGCYRRRPKRA